MPKGVLIPLCLIGIVAAGGLVWGGSILLLFGLGALIFEISFGVVLAILGALVMVGGVALAVACIRALVRLGNGNKAPGPFTGHGELRLPQSGRRVPLGLEPAW